MEQGFDFAQLKWIVIFAVFVLYKFLSAKPKVDNYDTQEGEAAEGEEPMIKRLEELFGDLSSSTQEVGDANETKRAGEPRVQRQRQSRAVPHASRSTQAGEQNSRVESSLKGGDLVENDEATAPDFDLRQAVIMSEILTRKYDE